jgi:hypothetical protein
MKYCERHAQATQIAASSYCPLPNWWPICPWHCSQQSIQAFLTHQSPRFQLHLHLHPHLVPLVSCTNLHEYLPYFTDHLHNSFEAPFAACKAPPCSAHAESGTFAFRAASITDSIASKRDACVDVAIVSNTSLRNSSLVR